MTTNEKIAALRAAAKAAGADGVLIMTSDPHCSEYLPGYYNALPWFSVDASNQSSTSASSSSEVSFLKYFCNKRSSMCSCYIVITNTRTG